MARHRRDDIGTVPARRRFARPTPQAEATELRLRAVARPDKLVAELLAHLDLQLPEVPKIVQNVVPQTAR
ncbi:MAG: hypothetical protein JJU00_15495 [Opitutales bacterium]|nr:hypothetical protein [Opitutales bacterium]